MTIKEQLMNDMKAAMRAHEMDKLTTVRFLMAEIKNFEIDNGPTEDDVALQKVIASQVKKSKDAISDFQKAGRDDLVDEETAKIKVMENYLPQQLTDDELKKVVTETINEVGELKNPGQLIGLVMKKVAGQADGKRVQEIIAQVNKD